MWAISFSLRVTVRLAFLTAALAILRRRDYWVERVASTRFASRSKSSAISSINCLDFSSFTGPARARLLAASLRQYSGSLTKSDIKRLLAASLRQYSGLTKSDIKTKSLAVAGPLALPTRRPLGAVLRGRWMSNEIMVLA